MRKRFLTNLVVGLTVSVISLTSVFASDVVKLKNGKSYDGEIVSEEADYIEIKVSIGSIKRTILVFRDQIDSLTMDGVVVVEDGEAVTAGAGGNIGSTTVVKATAETVVTPDDHSSIEVVDDNEIDMIATANKRVFVIPMEGMVGTGFRMDKLKAAVDMARPYNPDVIILRIDSGGGYLYELYKISDYIRELRDEFRVVAWIRSAISAAAMTAFNCREMYFMKEGNMGAATAFSGNTVINDDDNALWLAYAREMFVAGGWDPRIAQAMIVKEYWLSADIEILESGERLIHWHDTNSGEFVLSRNNENLVLDAREAYKFKIANAICDNEEELAEALNLDGWVEVSDAGRKFMENWLKTVERADKEIPLLYRKYQNAGQGGTARIALTQRAQIIRELIKWTKRLPVDMAEINYRLNTAQLKRDLKGIQAQLRRMDQ